MRLEQPLRLAVVVVAAVAHNVAIVNAAQHVVVNFKGIE